jgi:hypothetical protein
MVTTAPTWTVTSSRDHNFSSLVPAEPTTAQTNAAIDREDVLHIPSFNRFGPHFGGRVTFRGIAILVQIGAEGQRVATTSFPGFVPNFQRPAARFKGIPSLRRTPILPIRGAGIA